MKLNIIAERYTPASYTDSPTFKSWHGGPAVKIIMEKHREFNIEIHLAFIDYKKAFDKVNRHKLIEILTEYNIPNQLITAIYEIYKRNLIAVRLQAETSEWKTINCGVRQGCSLSPLLFIIHMNKIIQKWKVTRHGNVPINRNVNIETMLFADDQVLLAKSEDDLLLSTQFEQKSIRIFHGDKCREN
jgi:hypothetical protein